MSHVTLTGPPGNWTAQRARDTLLRLATDKALRARIEAPGADVHAIFLNELDIDIGYHIDPNVPVRLPGERALRRLAAKLGRGKPGRFFLFPFGTYTAGRRPYLAVLLLSARASDPP
jgi:hypothetical protein